MPSRRAFNRPGSGPHRPYEGSQQVTLPWVAPGAKVLIAPTRGRNKTSGSYVGMYPGVSSSPLRGVATPIGRCVARNTSCPHRPYEGSQRNDRHS